MRVRLLWPEALGYWSEEHGGSSWAPQHKNVALLHLPELQLLPNLLRPFLTTLSSLGRPLAPITVASPT